MLRPLPVSFGGLHSKHTESQAIIRMTIRTSDLNLITLIDGHIALSGGQVVNSLDLQALLKADLGRTLGGNGDGQVGIDGCARDLRPSNEVVSGRIHSPECGPKR